jgi:ribosomal protein L37E
MADTPSKPGAGTRSAPQSWAHVCERCGEQMEERQCKILCKNCGYSRDCSDP